MISRYIFKNVKKIIPRISPTELIALKSGDTSIDRDILSGKVDFKLKPHILEKKFPEEKLNDLISKYGNDIVFPSEKTTDIFKNIFSQEMFAIDNLVHPTYLMRLICSWLKIYEKK